MNDREQLTLRDVAVKAPERVGGLQGRALDREAKRRGLTLSYTTADRIIAGTYKSRPKGETIAALAQLSGNSVEQVRRTAGLTPQLRSFAEDLPPDADLLSPDQRRVVLDVIRQFARANSELYAARQNEAAEDREQRSAPINPAGESPAQNDAPQGDVDDMRRRRQQPGRERSTEGDTSRWAARSCTPSGGQDLTSGEESQGPGTDEPA